MYSDIKNKSIGFLESKTSKRRHIYQESITVYQVLGTPYKLEVTIHTSGFVFIKIFSPGLTPEFIEFSNLEDFIDWQNSTGITIENIP